MPHTRVILHIPDLAVALRSASGDRWPLLEKFFSRAENCHVSDETALLAESFGLDSEALAIAALERYAETGLRDGACWWRADPVHLAADRDQLVMLPQTLLAVTAEETQRLAETFNQNYSADGFALVVSRPDCWYLRAPADWQCRSWNPTRVAGLPVTEFMPTGPDENPLRKLMTEIQMLFHEHPVNQTREAAGKPPINSLWLWGGGRLPESVKQTPARIITSLPLVRGLARLAGQVSESWPVDLSEPFTEGEWLIALSMTDFANDGARLEREMFAPLWRRLSRGTLDEIRCYPGGTRIFILTRNAARSFWRRSRSLTDLLSESREPAPD